jgi:hypothetical protein
MANETKHVQFGEAKKKELDATARKLALEHKSPIIADLERRTSYRDEGKPQWHAYARFLLEDGHTIYVNLRTMEGSVSAKPNKWAVAKHEKQVKKAAAREAAKAAKLIKAETKKAEPKAKAKTVKVVKYNPKLPTVPAGSKAVKS